MDFSKIPLRPMQQPEIIGWWPLAPGWWVVIVASLLLLVLAFWFGRRWLQNYRQNPRRWALIELKSIQQSFQQHQDKRLLAQECNALLKRYALTLFPRTDVAHLNGANWVDFLQQQAPTEGLSVLHSGPYQPQPDYDEQQLFTACKQWLNQVKEPNHG